MPALAFAHPLDQNFRFSVRHLWWIKIRLNALVNYNGSQHQGVKARNKGPKNMNDNGWSETVAIIDGKEFVLPEFDFDGVRYAACPVVVTIGGANLSHPEPTYAAMVTGTDGTVNRHICTRSAVIEWLAARGLPPQAATILLAMSELVDAGEIEEKDTQEAAALANEEAGKIADGIEAEIAEGNFRTEDKISNRIADCIAVSGFVTDEETATRSAVALVRETGRAAAYVSYRFSLAIGAAVLNSKTFKQWKRRRKNDKSK
jgi:hypothetical protein